MKELYKQIFKYPGVVSVGKGFKYTGGQRTNEVCLVVGVQKKLPWNMLATENIIPSAIQGMRTDVIQTGIIRAFVDPTEKFRPLLGGISIGHRDITAGTLGCFVTKENKVFALSNNHVLANSNAGQIGDAIYQPGAYDGGTFEDTCGTLAEFLPISFLVEDGQCNTGSFIAKILNYLSETFGHSHRMKLIKTSALTNQADCALCALSVGFDNYIIETGKPTGSALATLGDPIHKFGRTTLHTEGMIEQVDMMVQVAYSADGSRIAVFDGQYAAGAMSAGGDSGSAILKGDKVVGLLFAGSETVTIINPIQYVLDAFGCEIYTE